MTPVIATLCELIRRNTVNPAYEDGGSEAHLLPVLESFFAHHGISTFTQEVFPGRHNLIAVLPGKTTQRLILEAHTDTVSIKGMSIPPFEPTLRSGRVYGRGSVDDKAGLAAMMHALLEVKASRITPPCEVWLAAVVDEESTYRGVVKLCEQIEASGAIVAEPTELKPVIASKGVLRWRLTVEGRAAHSSKPHLGINAIQHMAVILSALEEENQRLSKITHPLLTPPTLSVGTIRGGVQVNLVPDQCSIEIDRRLMPGESAEEVWQNYDALLARFPHIKAVNERPALLIDEALHTSTTTLTVQTACSVLQGMNLDAQPIGVPFGSDASKLARAGIPTIVFGPGSIDQAHTHDEFVPIAEVESALEFYKRFILAFDPGCDLPQSQA